MSEKKKTRYIIPNNVSAKFEILPGVGLKEFLITALVFVASFFATKIINIKTEDKMLIIVVPTALAFFGTREDESGMTLIKTLQFMVAFLKKQRRFFYKHID